MYTHSTITEQEILKVLASNGLIYNHNTTHNIIMKGKPLIKLIINYMCNTIT